MGREHHAELVIPSLCFMHCSLGRPANSLVMPHEISWHISDSSLGEYPVKLITWLHYSKIKLSLCSEVNTGEGAWMLLQEIKSSAYMAIFILHFVCFNRKWAHIYLPSMARWIKLHSKYSISLQWFPSWEAVSLNPCCLALHLCSCIGWRGQEPFEMPFLLTGLLVAVLLRRERGSKSKLFLHLAGISCPLDSPQMFYQ